MANLVLGQTAYPLEQECLLGRQKTCGIQIRDEKASRQHARVYFRDDGWWVEDLSSANGTKLNASVVDKQTRLSDGDIIAIGAAEIRFVDNSARRRKGHSTAELDVVGREINGYRIDRLIGRGVTGTIYDATQLALERGVAFKVMDLGLCANDPKFGERFLGVLKKAATIRHDGMVKIHESGVDDDGMVWYTMELVRGDTLETLLKRDGPMEPPLALLLAEKVAQALAAGHALDLVHGDLKPATIMVEETGHVKVLDIGMAGLTAAECRLVQGAAATRQVFYLAPEQAKGGANDVRSDIYSLGCVIHHALTGKPPFPGDAFDDIVAAHARNPVPPIAAKLGLPATVDSLLAKMMAKSASARPASMDEVVAGLRALRDAVSPDAHSEAAEREARARMAARTRPRKLHRKNDSLPGWATALVWGLILVGALLALSALGVFRGVTGAASAANTPTPPAATGGGDAPTATDQPPTTTSTAAADPLATRWQQVEKDVDDSSKAGLWADAETALAAFTAAAAKYPDSESAQSAHLRAQQLQNAGDDWFAKTVAALPKGDDPASAANRLNALASVRDQCLANARPDAEARYQEALATLVQGLSEAKRKARLALQAGRFDEVAAGADALAPAFKDTPVAALQRQFAAITGEAAKIQPSWQGDWPTTRAALVKAKGADALTAAAALLLSADLADNADARRLLTDPALADGDLLRRREALAGRQAAVLTFNDLADLQYIEELAGSPRLANGSLGSDEAAGIACTVPVGGDSWSAALDLALTPTPGADTSEAVISCVAGQDIPLAVTIGTADLGWKVKTAAGLVQAKTARPKEDHVRLRLACRKGQLRLLLDDQQVATFDQAQIPANSQFRIEIGGFSWHLKNLQVLGAD
jgi:hypothetical protein